MSKEKNGDRETNKGHWDFLEINKEKRYIIVSETIIGNKGVSLNVYSKHIKETLEWAEWYTTPDNGTDKLKNHKTSSVEFNDELVVERKNSHQ